MTPISEIHPLRQIPEGLYILDRDGMLWPTTVSDQIPPVCLVKVTMKPARTPAPPCLLEKPDRRPDEPMAPMARRKPTPVHVPKDELCGSPEEDRYFAEFQSKLKARRQKRDKKAGGGPKIDAKRIARAHREAAAKPPAPRKKPTRRALSDGECHRCGVRTTIGCDHFLPYIGS